MKTKIEKVYTQEEKKQRKERLKVERGKRNERQEDMAPRIDYAKKRREYAKRQRHEKGWNPFRGQDYGRHR